MPSRNVIGDRGMGEVPVGMTCIDEGWMKKHDKGGGRRGGGG